MACCTPCGVYGEIDLESIDVQPETNGEGKWKASEANFQLEVDDSPIKILLPPSSYHQSTWPTPPSSYHLRSENTVEVDPSLVNNAQTEPSTSTPPSLHHQISEHTIEIMPPDQKEISKRSSAESPKSLRSTRSAVSMVSETVRKNKKCVIGMAIFGLFLYSVIVIWQINIKGDGEED